MADGDSIATPVNRQMRLRQLIYGRESVGQHPETLIGVTELLDALFVLYNECTKDSFKRNKYAVGFVKKCEYFVFCRILQACTVPGS